MPAANCEAPVVSEKFGCHTWARASTQMMNDGWIYYSTTYS